VLAACGGGGDVESGAGESGGIESDELALWQAAKVRSGNAEVSAEKATRTNESPETFGTSATPKATGDTYVYLTVNLVAAPGAGPGRLDTSAWELSLPGGETVRIVRSGNDRLLGGTVDVGATPTVRVAGFEVPAGTPLDGLELNAKEPGGPDATLALVPRSQAPATTAPAAVTTAGATTTSKGVRFDELGPPSPLKFRFNDLDFTIERIVRSNLRAGDVTNRNLGGFVDSVEYLYLFGSITNPLATEKPCNFSRTVALDVGGVRSALDRWDASECGLAPGTSVTYSLYGKIEPAADLATAKLVWGKPTERQLVFPLTGPVPASPFPIDLGATGSFTAPIGYSGGEVADVAVTITGSSAGIDAGIDAAAGRTTTETRRSGPDTVFVSLKARMNNPSADRQVCLERANVRINADGTRTAFLTGWDSTSPAFKGCAPPGTTFGETTFLFEVPVSATTVAVEFGPLDRSVSVPVDMTRITSALAA
jgi:hypothetical protein